MRPGRDRLNANEVATSVTLATSQSSQQSAAPQCLSAAFRFDERSTKLFDEFMSNLQIGKAPAIIMLAFRQNCTSVSRLNMSGLVELKNPAVQFDIQPAGTDGKLDDVGVTLFRSSPT